MAQSAGGCVASEYGTLAVQLAARHVMLCRFDGRSLSADAGPGAGGAGGASGCFGGFGGSGRRAGRGWGGMPRGPLNVSLAAFQGMPVPPYAERVAQEVADAAAAAVAAAAAAAAARGGGGRAGSSPSAAPPCPRVLVLPDYDVALMDQNKGSDLPPPPGDAEAGDGDGGP